MKKIEIIKGVHSSVLGFGCAPILGAIDGKVAQRAIELALEQGINHFDLARSYGYGDAEAFVGNILRSKRNEVVIVTKFGIKANWKAQLLKPLKPIVRYFKKGKKAGDSITGKKKVINADRFHDRLPISSKTMVESLEQSLKALKTDYIDVLLIHEPLESILDIDGIIDTSETLKKEGKIRGLGLAFMQEQSAYHQDYLDKFDILQFNNSPSLRGYDNLVKNKGNDVNFFFSPFNSGNDLLKPEEKLKKLLEDFPKSVILCSMFNEKHIIANVKSVNA